MAKNDSIILDGILDDRIASRQPSDKRDEAFEYFAIEQILKDINLTFDEIFQGTVDGRNDGGIDSCYILVNGHLLTDIKTFFWPKSSAEIEVYLITCKHHDTFKQAPLDNMVASLTELFDLSIEDKELKGDYNASILQFRALLKYAYRKLSPRLTTFNIKMYYASRGDATIVGESILSRANQLIDIAEQSFGSCNASFSFFGSTELVELFRKVPNFSLELPFIEVLAKGERYVLLSRLVDYKNFIIDESGKLRRYLFDSNVRDFMGLNRVNEDIRNTLFDESSPDFWWMNNGVTILATSARVIGKTIHIEDIQIVNGLQTTESIYKYFLDGGLDPNNRSVLVKVLVSQENQVRDAIIRATNNQTTVEISALHATDKIQRDIEDILLLTGYYYERRTNFYINQDIKPEFIVTPLYMASGYLALVNKEPTKASNLKSKFMRLSESYEEIFSSKQSLEVWPNIARILKTTDAFLESIRPGKNTLTEGFLKKWRYLVSFITVSRLLASYNYSTNDFIALDPEKYNNEEISKTWKFIQRIDYVKSGNGKKKSANSIWRACELASEEFGISGWNILMKKNNFTPKPKQLPIYVDEKFVEKVDSLLPAQPWKPGTHRRIASILNCSDHEIYKAVNVLIDKGTRYRQKDGLLFNAANEIVDFDRERVDAKTMKLKDGTD